MGNGVCSRKQKKIFQSLLLVTVVFGMIYGGMVSYEMHKQLKRTESLALKYQQHQESLSAQLQGKTHVTSRRRSVKHCCKVETLLQVLCLRCVMILGVQ